MSEAIIWDDLARFEEHVLDQGCRAAAACAKMSQLSKTSWCAGPVDNHALAMPGLLVLTLRCGASKRKLEFASSRRAIVCVSKKTIGKITCKHSRRSTPLRRDAVGVHSTLVGFPPYEWAGPR